MSREAPTRGSVLERRLSLGEMLDGPTFSEVVKGFVELYRIGIKVFDERGTKLADLKIGNGDFCGYVFSFAEGRSLCTQTVTRVKEGPHTALPGSRLVQDGDRELLAVDCFTGLRYLVMPIAWDGDLLGRIVFGPFIPDELRALPASLTSLSPGLEHEKAQALMEKVRRAPETTVIRVMQHFRQIVETMVAAGQKMFLATQVHLEATLESNRELEEKSARLEAMNSRLKELDRLKSAFLATVSHELRTPLTSIIGYSEMLSEGLAGPMNPEQIDYVRTIMDKGETLLKLISSILDLSQIEAGKVRLNFEPSDLPAILRTSVSSVMPQAQKKGVALEVKLPQASQPHVFADRDRLRQVVVNLLANALKFTGSGGRVTLSLSAQGPQDELGVAGYRITVEDSGVGIPKEQFDRIFDSFYQVDSSSTREFGGAGLGLAIVKSFVEGHGGRVLVTSEVGKGSCFVLVLPCEAAAPKPVAPLLPVSVPSAERF